jgi:hypothetical protein
VLQFKVEFTRLMCCDRHFPTVAIAEGARHVKQMPRNCLRRVAVVPQQLPGNLQVTGARSAARAPCNCVATATLRSVMNSRRSFDHLVGKLLKM